mmetsp:Transcript_101974/g.293675  ORF Transcript_101974/g.293675 Transcript_101974/m.293675 type:complete len:516 (-) Transcript_101974:66-1613(-)
MADELELFVWFHPSMQIPVQFDPKAHPFKVSGNETVVDLMDKTEDFFKELTSKSEPPLDMQITVLWNIKDHKKALAQNEKIGQHFVSGESFGVYGEILPAEPEVELKAEDEKIPVTILTGFLGSGKTTLLNFILKEQQEKKIAIIENEFGEISIDDALLSQSKLSMAEKIVVMDNGCMCCTIRGDLADGLKQILDDIKAGTHIDQIMIETTGMADPVPIVRTFMSNPELTMDLRLDAVIALADAKNLVGRLDDKVEEGKVNEAYQQIAFADKIILNKLDLVSTEQAIVVRDRIREINKFARILGAMNSRVRMEELCNIRAHDMCNFVNMDIEKEAEFVAEFDAGHGSGHGHEQGHGGHGHEEGHGSGHGGNHGQHHDIGHVGGHSGDHRLGSHPGSGHGHVQGHSSGDSRHDTRVNSFAFVREGEIAPGRLAAFFHMLKLSQMVPDRGTIFRIKAILAVKRHPCKVVFHAVMDVSDEDTADPWKEGEKKLCKIVFIGKSLDRAFFERAWESNFVG